MNSSASKQKEGSYCRPAWVGGGGGLGTYVPRLDFKACRFAY